MSFKEMQHVKLKEVTLKIGSGATPRGGKEAYLDDGEYSLIRSQNILDFFFSNDGLAFINEEQASRLDNVKVEEGDVLLNITGDSVARVCQVPSNVLPARVNQHVSIIRPDKNILLPDYLKYYLLNPTYKNKLLSLAAVGATRNALTKGMIEELDLKIPDIETQTKAASILNAIDRKIELNIRTNKTLENIAQLIFKEWFVSFNFPNSTGEFYSSEQGEIPKGWKVGYLSEIFDFLEGPGLRHWQYKEVGIPFINIRLINGNDINVKDANFVSEEEALGKYKHFLLQPKDIVISTSGTLGRNAIVRESHLPLMLNTSVIRFRPIDGISYPFLYQFLNSDYFISELTANASGSVQLNFGPSHLKRIQMIIPEQTIIDEYTRIAQPIYDKILRTFDENQSLELTRNTLLPKLMKGEIEFK